MEFSDQTEQSCNCIQIEEMRLEWKTAGVSLESV